MSGPRGRGVPWQAAALLLALAAVSRVAWLTERPLHHDEGVNSWKTEQLLKTGRFQYDPSNYHGPTLFFLQLGPTLVAWALAGGGPLTAGLTEASLRAGVALAGWLLLLLVWLARGQLGRLGALVALLLLGSSPGLLYYSRDFIHETHHLLFTLLLWLALARFAAGASGRWLVVAAAAAALGFCTKETFPISAAGIGLGVLVAGLVGRLPPGAGPARLPALAGEARALLARARPQLFDAAIALVAIWFFLFSSFLRHLRGPIDSFEAYLPWAETAAGSGHDKALGWYLTALIGPYEPALAGAAVLGLLVALATRERLGLLLAGWSLSVLGVYSAIPYKTPWLVLNALLPMGLLGGWGVQRLALTLARWPRARRPLAATLAAALAGSLLWQAAVAARLVYREPEDHAHAYVYVQTQRDVRRLLARVAVEAAALGGEALKIDVVSSDYWPLPFYFEPYQARFWGTLDDVELDAPLVIGEARQRTQLAERLGPGWQRLSYDLRPGVKLDLYARSHSAP